MQWFKRKYKITPVPYRFYAASLLSFFLGALSSKLIGEIALEVASTLAYALIILGFIVWCLPAARWMKAMWDRPFGKTPIVLVHVFVLLLATSLSRLLTSHALGLPPQSFDVTVGFLALFFYIPAWIAVASVFSVLFGTLLAVAIMIMTAVVGSIQMLAPLLKIIGLDTSLKRNPIAALFHSAGAIATGLILITAYSFLTETYQPWVFSAIRFIAVKADFHPAANYPGTTPSERIHPLENGYVAYARLANDKNLVIGVRSQTEEVYDKLLPAPVATVNDINLPFLKVESRQVLLKEQQ